MIIDNKIQQLIKKIENVAPLNSSVKSNLFYPYKPALILSLMEVYNDYNNFFDQEINLSKFEDIDNSKVYKNFYDFLTMDFDLFNTLNKQKSKNTWIGLGFNKFQFEQIKKLLFEMPIPKLKNEFIDFNKKSKTIIFYSFNYDKEELFNLIKSIAIKTLYKCIPNYKNLEISNILSLDYSSLNDDLINYSNNLGDDKKRLHWYRKIVLDRDGKCLICCEENTNILNACHIKPYCNSNNHEANDPNNGITLCCNHHKLFDDGLFTFNNDWTISLSPMLIKQEQILDDALKFKRYEKCYSKLTMQKHHIDLDVILKQYFDYHNKFIFKS